MCGIVGEFNATQPVNEGHFEAMAQAIAHRGPDAKGSVFLEDGQVALGHHRLSIIDLSNAGLQPMANDDHSVWVVYNGEIYNFESLRSDLEQRGHVFRSRTDTEVILRAYEEWGVDSVKRLRGIFAFGIWDSNHRRLWLARDHLGVKPLYYYHDGRRFIFASELKAILADPSIPRSLSYPAMSDYLTYGYVPFDRSIFQGIWKLPAGHHLLLSNGHLRIEEYWDVAYTGEITDEVDAAEQLKEGLQEAVRLQLISDVPLGVFLSGGVDSSAVSALIGSGEPNPIRTFTIGFNEQAQDETPYARRVASFLGTEHQERILSYDTARELIPRFFEIYDEPFYDSSGIPMYLLSQFARPEVKVALAGDGGDEVFAGYNRYDRFIAAAGTNKPNPTIRFASKLAWRPMRRMGMHFAPLLRFGHKMRQLTQNPVEAYYHQFPFLDREQQTKLLSHRIIGDISDDPLWLFNRFWREDYPHITAAQYLDIKTYLVDDILAKVDRASMAHGLEVRVPLLDHKLVETAFKISSKLMYYNHQRKYIFKKALHGILPDDILSARKKGFSVPMNDWFAKGLRKFAAQMLYQGSLVNRSIIDPVRTKEFVSSEPANRVWLLLVLEMWARRWLENERITSVPEGLLDIGS